MKRLRPRVPTPFFLFEFGNRPVPRERWLEHRERMLHHYTNFYPGKRPVEWWQYEASEPRDHSVHQRLQLFRLGALEGIELMKVRAIWTTTEERAASGLLYTLGRGSGSLEGPAAYQAWRNWAGVPEELYLPIHPPAPLDPRVGRCFE
jgi:hypothetical protein